MSAIRVKAPSAAGAVCTVCAFLFVTAAAADEVILKDGNRIAGEVVKLVGGKLTIKTASAGEITVSWAEVVGLTTEKPLPFHLSGERSVEGRAVTDAAGGLSIESEDAPPLPVGFEEVASINPPVKPPVTYKGNVNLGGAVADGNTRRKSATALAEFEARSEHHRFNISGAWQYAEDEGSVTARNARGSAKYDYFITKRFYVFASALLEGDSEQDLNTRTALSAGPGYQIFDEGDFEEEWLSGLELFGEAGLSYFHEDFERPSEDNEYVAARWAAKLDWPIVPDRLTLFHRHEGFPGLERSDDLYIRTEQGARITIIDNFFAAFQVNWTWDNTPAQGRRRADTVYLLTFGYSFSF